MIDQKKDPVAWSQLIYGLDDARDHLKDLVDKMTSDGLVDEDEFRIALGHVYAHLNRAWHSRDLKEEIPQKDWAHLSRFPEDVSPVG